MTRILCIVGIHRPVYVPVLSALATEWAPPLRRCYYCGCYLRQDPR